MPVTDVKQFAETGLGRTCIHNGKEKEKTESHNPKHGCMAT